VLLLKFVSPLYTAVMECRLPLTVSDDVEQVAWALTFRPTLLQIVVVPSLKVTVPVGVPEPGATALTAAVNVTDWPNTEGLAEDTTAVLVLAAFTVSEPVA
jgi:hypothetical protein